MYRFFVKPEQLMASPVIIDGEDYNHIHNVLRMKTGENILLCAEDSKEYLCQIDSYNEETERVYVNVIDVFGNNRELSAEIVLFQGLPKGDKMDTIIQKAVELGVSTIVPVSMERCVVKCDEKKALKKVERYRKIALSAAKQSKRGKIPTVTDVMTVQEACKYAVNLQSVLLPYEMAKGIQLSKDRIKEAVKCQSIGIFIGPEGGFTKEEINLLTSIGGKQISLGHRILRTETAGMTVLSILMFLLECDDTD